MKYFSVPSDFRIETIDKLHELNSRHHESKVIETYGQVTDFKGFNSGRSRELLPQVSMENLERYVEYSSGRGIEFNYTLNPSCVGNYELSSKGVTEFTTLLNKLYEAGVTSLTIAMPSLIEMVKASKYKFKIKASAISQISSPNKALFYKSLGVDRVVIDEDITRNFKIIKEITSAFGDGVEIIVNSACYKDCAYKMFHYNHESHTHQNSADNITSYYFHRCAMQKMKDIRNMIKVNWIRPEDLKYYMNSGIHYFKIQGRQAVVKGDIIKTLEHYIREDYDGDLVSLLTLFIEYSPFQNRIDNKKLDGFIDTYYNNAEFCKDNCAKCDYCYNFAKKSMDYVGTVEKNKQGISFYNDFDPYNKLIKEENETNTVHNQICENDINIDFKF